MSFKEYLESKNKLREALQRVPQRTAEYRVKEYCKLVIGESKDQKRYIPLKPNQKIFVDWKYDNMDNPTINSLQFEGVHHIDCEQEFATPWQGKKLQQWLSKNTRETTPKRGIK